MPQELSPLPARDTGILRGLFDTDGIQLTNLPGSRNEVEEAARVLGGIGNVVLVGAEATKAAIESQPLQDFKILHFAVHAIPSVEYPERAALVLRWDPSGREEDPLLEEGEIARMVLHAELVTLSACDTAVGKLEGEEGVVSLADAFLIAGARTVVATLWEVPDNSTSEIMEHFYRYIAEGMDRDLALREAKLDYLHQHNNDAPVADWAGIEMVGEGEAPIPLETR